MIRSLLLILSLSTPAMAGVMNGGGASSGGGAPTGAAGGDLSGTYPNPTVGTIANPVSSATINNLTTGGVSVGGVPVQNAIIVSTGGYGIIYGTMTVTSSMTAGAFFGDGSHLTGVTGGSSFVLYSTTVFFTDFSASTMTSGGASNFSFATVTIPTSGMPTTRGQCIALNGKANASSNAAPMSFYVGYSSAGVFTVLASIPNTTTGGQPFAVTAYLKYAGGNNFTVTGKGLAGDSGNIFKGSLGGLTAGGGAAAPGQSSVTPYISIPVSSGQSFIFAGLDVNNTGNAGHLSFSDGTVSTLSACP